MSVWVCTHACVSAGHLHSSVCLGVCLGVCVCVFRCMCVCLCVSVCICVFRHVVYIRADINRQASSSEMNERADCVEADEVA